MTRREFVDIKPGTELYVGGRTRRRGQCGTVTGVYPYTGTIYLKFEGVPYEDPYSYRVLFREPTVDNDEELIDITFTMNVIDNVDVTFGAVLGIVNHILYPRGLINNYEAKIDQICDNTVSVGLRGLPKWVFDELEKYSNWCNECARREAEVKED